MAEASRLEQLERRVRELEEELAREKGGRRAPRARIESMSPEVTDSNPYRCGGGGDTRLHLRRLGDGERAGAEPRGGGPGAESGRRGWRDGCGVSGPWVGTVGLGKGEGACGGGLGQAGV